MDLKRLPLFYSDIFIYEDVGTDEQREDLKKQILHAKENDVGTAPNSNDGCWRSDARYDCEWLNSAIYKLSDEANILVMPGLNSANISYKLLQKLGGGSVIGPILLGGEHPVQIVPMGATVADLLNAAIFNAYGSIE